MRRMLRDVSGPIAIFAIDGEPCGDTLNRVLGLFSRLGLTPIRVAMRRGEDMAHVEIVQDELDEARAAVLAEKMRSMVAVSTVTLEYE